MSEMNEKNKGFGILVFIGLFIFASSMVFSMSRFVDVVYVSNDNLVVTDIPLKKIYEGEHYYYKNYSLLSNLNENKTFFIEVNEKQAHMIFEFGNQDTTQYELFENCTSLDKGVKTRTFNRKRVFDNNSTTLLYEDAVVNYSHALRIYNARYTEKKFNPGITRDNREIILKPNTDYCFVITDLVNAEDHINYLFDWYESDPDE